MHKIPPFRKLTANKRITVHRYRCSLSAILLLGRLRNRADEMAVYCKFILLSHDNSNESFGSKSGLQLPNLPRPVAKQVQSSLALGLAVLTSESFYFLIAINATSVLSWYLFYRKYTL